MAANFPRIHSMTTVGIKQHFDCDYLFHPLRTDFSGESGSGKSMVADMIQLILVCTGAYRSATQSNANREPKGMVIQPKGRQSGIGYIVLNIETYPGKYIAIGACLESAHNKVLPLVVQGGYDWEETLTPLTQPVRYRDLKPGNTILPLNDLSGQLSGMYLKPFTKRKFHQLLFDHGLVPLDLTNDATLKDYASILQSFSRDSGFKTDSESLKNFLFGHEDQNKFQQQFKEEVDAIEREFQDQEKFHEEIELINQKEQGLVQVHQLNTVYREKEKTYLNTLNHYWYNKAVQDEEVWKTAEKLATEKRVESEVIEAKQRGLEVEDLKALEKLLEEQRQLQEQKRPQVPEDYEAVKQKHDRLVQYRKWLEQHENNPQDVSGWYGKERKKVKDKSLLNDFEEHLDKHEQRAAFEASDWSANYAETLARYDEHKTNTETRLAELQALSAFSNIADAESLGAWALDHLDFPVSHEQESVLVHFQQLPRSEPDVKTNARYLPFPENLIENLKVEQVKDSGFWIDLDGVYEYIAYVPNRYLGVSSTDEIKTALSNVSSSVEDELRTLQLQHQKDENLYSVLHQFPALEEAVALYAIRETVRTQTPETSLTPEEFQQHEEAYQQQLQVEAEYQEKHRQYELATRSQEKVKAEAEKLEDKIKAHRQYFGWNDVTPAVVRAAIGERITPAEWDDDGETAVMRKTTESRLFPEEVSLTRVLKLQAHHAELKTTAAGKEENSKKQRDFSRQQEEKAKELFVLAFKDDWQADPEHPPVPTNPDEGENSLKQEYEKAKSAFERRYDVVKESTDNPQQLAGYSVGLLAHKLLPTVFLSPKFDESLIEQQIATRLTKLTIDLQVIGSRKLEILKRVFSEVYHTYQGYLTKVEGINRYFRKKNLGITGGNRASLIYQKSPDYPEKWLAPFRKQLDEYSKEVTEGLFSKLTQEIDIYAMMKKAFQNAGGSPKVGPEELLNPKSYFRLDFDIKDSTGQQNAGSQGQTYTANALLCLARLSLIEEENRPGIRIMPIDEAQGLGSNYDMLHELAKAEKFQVLSMSIETAGDMKPDGQYVYIMNENNQDDTTMYVPPLGIFSDGVVRKDIDAYITNSLADG